MGENDNIPQMTPSFENICRKDENGNEYWSSRDLCGAMGYSAIQKMLCCGILLMFSLLQRLKICWGTNWGRNFAGQKKKRANIESLFIPYRRFRFPKI